jgi:hypothetical protein
MNSISLKYHLRHESSWREKVLSIADYFDLNEEEELDIDSPVLESNLLNYVGVAASQIMLIRLELEINGKSRSFRQSFWNNGENFIIERIDSGIRGDRELILVTSNSGDSRSSEVIRVVDFGEALVPVYHSVSFQNCDGLEIDLSLSLEEFTNLDM